MYNGILAAWSLPDIGDLINTIITNIFGAGWLLQIGAGAWNAFMETVQNLLLLRPDGAYGSADMSPLWSVVANNIYPIFFTIGASMLCLYFAFNFCRESVDIRQTMTAENTLLMFARLVIANTILLSLMRLIQQFFGIVQGLTQQVMGITGSNYGEMLKISQSQIDRIAVGGMLTMVTEFGGDSGSGVILINYLLALIFLVVCILFGAVIVFTCFSRLLKIYLIIPFAPIAIASIGGGNGMGRSATQWLKTFLTYSLEVVVIALTLGLGSIFFQRVQIFANGSMLIVELILKLLIITATVKGADKILREALGT